MLELSADRVWGLLMPLLHAPAPVAEPALRILAQAAAVKTIAPVLADMGCSRPLLTLDAPKAHPLKSHIVQLYKSPRGREASAVLLGLVGNEYSTQLGISDDERRALSTLVGLISNSPTPKTLVGACGCMSGMLSYRSDRTLLLDVRFVENVLVPEWRAATSKSKEKGALGSLLNRVIGHEAFQARLVANFERRGRSPLLGQLMTELRVESEGKEAIEKEQEPEARVGTSRPECGPGQRSQSGEWESVS